MNSIAEEIILNTNPDNVEQQGVAKRTYRLIYKSNAPWEIGEVQPSLVDIIKTEAIESPILDVGCGYGTNSLYMANNKFQVHAIDYLPEVIELAKQCNEHPSIFYEAQDIFQMADRIENFKTIIDFATFHGFSNEERVAYAKMLGKFLKPGSRLFICGFSNKEQQKGGPRRLSKKIFEELFSDQFNFDEVLETDYKTVFFNGSVKAILVKMTKR